MVKGMSCKGCHWCVNPLVRTPWRNARASRTIENCSVVGATRAMCSRFNWHANGVDHVTAIKTQPQKKYFLFVSRGASVHRSKIKLLTMRRQILCASRIYLASLTRLAIRVPKLSLAVKDFWYRLFFLAVRTFCALLGFFVLLERLRLPPRLRHPNHTTHTLSHRPFSLNLKMQFVR